MNAIKSAIKHIFGLRESKDTESGVTTTPFAGDVLLFRPRGPEDTFPPFTGGVFRRMAEERLTAHPLSLSSWIASRDEFASTDEGRKLINAVITLAANPAIDESLEVACDLGTESVTKLCKFLEKNASGLFCETTDATTSSDARITLLSWKLEGRTSMTSMASDQAVELLLSKNTSEMTAYYYGAMLLRVIASRLSLALPKMKIYDTYRAEYAVLKTVDGFSIVLDAAIQMLDKVVENNVVVPAELSFSHRALLCSLFKISSLYAFSATDSDLKLDKLSPVLSSAFIAEARNMLSGNATLTRETFFRDHALKILERLADQSMLNLIRYKSSTYSGYASSIKSSIKIALQMRQQCSPFPIAIIGFGDKPLNMKDVSKNIGLPESEILVIGTLQSSFQFNVLNEFTDDEASVVFADVFKKHEKESEYQTDANLSVAEISIQQHDALELSAFYKRQADGEEFMKNAQAFINAFSRGNEALSSFVSTSEERRSDNPVGTFLSNYNGITIVDTYQLVADHGLGGSIVCALLYARLNKYKESMAEQNTSIPSEIAA